MVHRSPVIPRSGLFWVSAATLLLWLILAALMVLDFRLRTIPRYPTGDWRRLPVVQASLDSGGRYVCALPLTLSSSPAKLAQMHAALAKAQPIRTIPRDWRASIPPGGILLEFSNGDQRLLTSVDQTHGGSHATLLPGILALSRSSWEGNPLHDRFLNAPALWRLLGQPNFFPVCPLSS